MANTSFGYRLQMLNRIHLAILRGGYPNATSLAKLFCVSVKTMKKYIRDLQELMGGPPEYEPSEHGYHYPRGMSPQITPRLNDQEVLAYFLLEETARSLAGTPVQNYLESALSKFSVLLPVGEGLTLSDVSNAMSLRLERAPARSPEPAVLAQLCDAISKRRRVTIQYTGQSRKESTCRVIEPLHLTRCEGQWYLMAHCTLRKDVRTFVPSRISRIEMLAQHFDSPEGFDAVAHFKSAFGIVAGPNVIEVRLLFSPDVAGYVSERNWHPTQTVDKLPDDRVRLTLKCTHGQELTRWLMSWGSAVTIESPAMLRQELIKSHSSAAAHRIAK